MFSPHMVYATAILSGSIWVGSWLGLFVWIVTGTFNLPEAAPITQQVSDSAAKQKTEDRLNSDFSRLSERYRQGLQHGRVNPEDAEPDSTQAKRRRQALEDLADRDRQPVDAQPHPRRQPPSWIMQFQLQLEPQE